MALPIKTTADDIEALSAFLRTQVGWTSIENVRKAIPSRYADNRKVEAMRYLGLLERDGVNIKLSEAGRAYASATEAARQGILGDQIRTIPLYFSTLQWIHFHNHERPSRTDVANYWHDKHEDETGGARGDALTDAVVFFMRVADMAGLGTFVPAGRGRGETHLRSDPSALAAFVTGDVAEPQTSAASNGKTEADANKHLGVGGARQQPVSVSRGLQVNVEIHMAADAKPATIEEIFRNMRRYLIDERAEAVGS